MAGCGGGGGGGSSSGGGTGTGGGGSGGGGGGSGSASPTYTPGVFEPSSNFVDRCAMPRPGTSDRSGSIVLENFWLRSWSNELYLWYDEIQDRNPYNYNDNLDYFELLKTNELTPSGAPKDQFHFTYDTAEYQQLVNSGAEVQYGAEFVILRGAPPRDIRIAFVQAGSPAANAGLARGTRILAIDGVDVANGSDVDTLNDGLFPSNAGESHTFRVRDLGSSTERNVTLTAQTVAVNPVQQSSVLDVNGDKVGYLHLTTFGVVTAEEQLIDAMTQFSNEGVTDLVVDLRYNGGGFLDISAELGYMIAGPDQIGNAFYEELVFNDKYPNTNPVTGEALTPTPFHSTSQGFSVNQGQPLPDLDLERVYFLSQSGTCSASESVINALRGIDVEVVLVGGTTCGKPYGFYGTDNCGTTYFSIQFRGENAKGFGDYADGFIPVTGTPTRQSEIQGCVVGDDFGHLLGDPDEAMLRAALNYRATGSCSGVATTMSASARLAPQTVEDPQLFMAGSDRYNTLDPNSLYASEAVRERLRRNLVRDMTLNRPLSDADIESLRKEELE
uniref:Peptidase S41 n=1 Tax=Aquisalinus luteolus TaxID=1566827 RepID=A0A8J3A387_9PROT|nr:peptidase S41 [Aquisalinus luteolus]